MGAFHFRQQRSTPRHDLLPPERNGRRHGIAPGAPREIVDADFVVIREPSPRPRGTGIPDNDNRRAIARERFVTVFKVLRRVAVVVAVTGEKLLQQVPAGRFPFLVAFAFLTVFGLAGGFAALAGAPAPVIAPTALDITHVNLTPQDANGMRVLMLTAIVENPTGTTRALPAIRADLVSGGRLLARTLIAPPAAELSPGQSRGITTRLPHPGGKIPDVRLSFTDSGVSFR